MATPKIVPKNSLSPSESVPSPNTEPGAKQEFKDDADLNSIMRKFQKTGAIDHVAKHGGSYGETSPQTYHEAMNTITRANSMFEELPSSVRNRFANEPEAFLAFVQNPDNSQEARDLGIALSPEAAVAASELPGAANPGASEGQVVQDETVPEKGV